MDLVPKGCYNEGDNFEKKKYDIFSSPLLLKPLCSTHGCNCPGLASVDMDVSGLPCVDNSRSKTGRLFQEGPSGPLFVVGVEAQTSRDQDGDSREHSGHLTELVFQGCRMFPYSVQSLLQHML